MVYSVLNGLGGAFLNTPCISSIGHFFLLKRGNATGIAMTYEMFLSLSPLNPQHIPKELII
jgi:hypothetical protein